MSAAMSQWFRIFGRNDVQPAPADLLEALRDLGVEATAHFRGDDLGWFQADFTFDADAPSLRLERYLTKEDAIRGELNTWAAWLENTGDSPTHLQLMQDIINITQLFTLHQLSEDADDPETDPHMEAVCLDLCQFVAKLTEGFYQADHHGFFSSDGTLLVAE
jgi:hypothetical protein